MKMKRSKSDRKHPKRRESGGKRFVRRIQLDGLLPERKGLELTVRGMNGGMIRMEAADGENYVCRRERSLGALYGDRVEATQTRPGEVEVYHIVRHAHETLTGIVSIHGPFATLLPLERHIPSEIELAGDRKGARDGDIVAARMIAWPDEGARFTAQITKKIGSFRQAKYAVEALILSSGLRTEFDEDALRQAQACRPASLADDPGREDLRDLLSFTIDGRDAKDFDDAVSLQALPDGNWLLGVHIADVGCYVPQGSALDREAFARGTSVYLPGRVLPMLPEALSNGVCSLRPDEDKWTLSALMTISPEGERLESRIVRTITRSKARLVYDDVNALFDGDETQRTRLSAVAQSLEEMRGLACKLRSRRERMGCIDFETEEPQFLLDEQGEPVEILLRERGEAERMIEDFMLEANACVAACAREKGLPILYRVHEEPDAEKIQVFADFLKGIGVDARALNAHVRPGDIRQILESTKDREEYRVIAALALRSMQKARYDAHPLGHYGLAMRDYCHFTSPIRRYPDLVVSRALSAMLLGERPSLIGDALETAAQHSSDCERNAADAERSADKLMMARVMAGHVGERCEGVISGMSDWGFYVALQNGAEGFIHVRTMDEWFTFDARKMALVGEQTGARFTLGETVEVIVDSVELMQNAVNLTLAQPKTRRGMRKAR